MTRRKKLIEVALPLAAINKADARLNSLEARRRAGNLQGQLERGFALLDPQCDFVWEPGATPELL